MGARKRRSVTGRTRSPSINQQSPRQVIDARVGALTSRCESLLHRLGCSRAAIVVEITSDGKLLAGALGLNLNGFAIGRVIIDDRLLKALPYDELEFVLAHEVSHIFRNHLADSLTAAAVRALIEGEACKDDDVKLLLLAWDVWKVIRALQGHLPPTAATTRANELEADALAVWLTRDKAAARRSLLRIVGNDPDAPSHVWEVFGTTMPLPALSMRDRLAALDLLPY